MTNQNDSTKSLVDRLESLKEEIASLFDDLGLGKDQLLRAHDAIDVASSAVASAGAPQGHDLNDDLAEKPEDHPREQGQGERPPINTDENVNQAVTEGDVQYVVSGVVPTEAPADAADEQPAPETPDAPAEA